MRGCRRRTAARVRGIEMRASDPKQGADPGGPEIIPKRGEGTTAGATAKGAMMPILRRNLLAGAALSLVFSATAAKARTIAGALPWEPDTATPPLPVEDG